MKKEEVFFVWWMNNNNNNNCLREAFFVACEDAEENLCSWRQCPSLFRRTHITNSKINEDPFTARVECEPSPKSNELAPPVDEKAARPASSHRQMTVFNHGSVPTRELSRRQKAAADVISGLEQRERCATTRENDGQANITQEKQNNNNTSTLFPVSH